MEQDEQKFQFIPKPSDVSWNDLIQLWRTSYEERKAEGLLYGASVQDDETLIKRASAGTCFCAVVGGELAGTLVASDKGIWGGGMFVSALRFPKNEEARNWRKNDAQLF